MTDRQDLNSAPESVANWIARLLEARGVSRVFGLQGGHIQPIWDHLAQRGIRIVDVRDDGAAVHMAHAHAELTGELGVALATAGPGVTNCVTGMANASLARVPLLLIGGCTSRHQANMGPLQDIPHVDILRPGTRYSRTARVAEQVIREIDEAIARAKGDMGEPGPSYIEVPTDVLRTRVGPSLIPEDWIAPKPARRISPDPADVAQAVAALRAAKRPLVVTGRGARGSGASVAAFLDAVDALYPDTQESRELVRADHPPVVGAVRAAAMAQADLVVTLGRKLDYQLGFGSPAVFPEARFLRISDTSGEVIDNRRGTEILASVGAAFDAITAALGNDAGARDEDWLSDLRAKHRARIGKGKERTAPKTGRRWQDPCPRDLRGAQRRGRCRPHRHRGRGRSSGLRAHRADGDDLYGRGRRRRALRRCRRAGLPRPADDLGQLRRGLWDQRDGDRNRRPAWSEGRLHRVQQRGVEHRPLRPGVQLWRPGGGHDAPPFRLRGHGARPHQRRVERTGPAFSAYSRRGWGGGHAGGATDRRR